MKRLAIGITPSHNTENDGISLCPTYLRAIQVTMAIPVVLPLETIQGDLGQLVHMCDGLLFSGSPDPHPFFFGEETQAHCGNASVIRDTIELLLLKAAMAVGKPILGICRGAQIINVGLGGIIYQDIPSQTERNFPTTHKQPLPYPVPSHHVTVLKGSLLVGTAVGQAELAVNSLHHQAVQTPAPGPTISAYALNGIIEAVEVQGYPYLLGIQQHPEHMWPKDRATVNIFKSFVEAYRQCEDYMQIRCGLGVDQSRSGKLHGRTVARYDLDTVRLMYL